MINKTYFIFCDLINTFLPFLTFISRTIMSKKKGPIAYFVFYHSRQEWDVAQIHDHGQETKFGSPLEKWTIGEDTYIWYRCTHPLETALKTLSQFNTKDTIIGPSVNLKLYNITKNGQPFACVDITGGEGKVPSIALESDKSQRMLLTRGNTFDSIRTTLCKILDRKVGAAEIYSDNEIYQEYYKKFDPRFVPIFEGALRDVVTSNPELQSLLNQKSNSSVEVVEEKVDKGQQETAN